jgi:predicted nucleotidyltransferase
MMAGMVTPERALECKQVVRSVAHWAVCNPGVVGVAVVGSWAREEARLDSDLDLVILSNDVPSCTAGGAWIEEIVGQAAELLRCREWGALTERRLRLASGFEVELGFVPATWAATDPVDPGTAQVVRGGCTAVVDPHGAFAQLVAAVRAP